MTRKTIQSIGLLGALVFASYSVSRPRVIQSEALTSTIMTQQMPSPEVPLEGYPSEETFTLIGEAISLQISQPLNSSDDKKLLAVISGVRSWDPGTRLRVAFKGGTNSSRTAIASTVRAWEEVANIQFDFWSDAAKTKFREWSTADSEYAADIRISFDKGKRGGLWSAVGKESNTRTKFIGSLAGYPPHKPSMNLEGLEEQVVHENNVVVLHEFGHALGFLHEQQSPKSTCEAEYRWYDDAGYSGKQDTEGRYIAQGSLFPGIYTVLGGYPFYWELSKIEYNLKQFANLADSDLISSFDEVSVMKYTFPQWMYRDLEVSSKSGCYSLPPNALSSKDKAAAYIKYPRDPKVIATLVTERIRVLNDASKIQSLNADVKKSFLEEVKRLRTIR